jgi:cation/acetate symporter
MGWTGGFCLVALLVAPYLRRFGHYTIPDFLAARYGDGMVRIIAVAATIIVSFTYVVAQIYGVGLITSRFTGVDFSVGIFLGLASILVCSFLGGMRAVTWTQVAQYIVILIACLIPVAWLSIKHTGNPVPQIAYGAVLSKLSEREQVLKQDASEQEVRDAFARHAEDYAQKIRALPRSWEEGRVRMQQAVEELKRQGAPLLEVRQASRAAADYPKSVEEARSRWEQARVANLAAALPPAEHARPFAAADPVASDGKRNNFLALMLCLMMGTAALPHLLTRYYTTPSVAATRTSVGWTMFFILLIYLTIPALAVLVKYDIYTSLVGSEFSQLPAWVSYWHSVDKTAPLVAITDVNRDGIVQLAEIALQGDIVVLATPEIAGLPYVISALIAAGGLAAALSTADGLLLTISGALSHDIYYKSVDPHASTQKRVTIAKLLLLAVTLVAAYVASSRPGNILSLVGAAFSLAASALFPALVLGIFWKRANRLGAIAGILTGFGMCVFYMAHTQPALGGSVANQWLQVAPYSAGIFAVPAGFLAAIAASLVTRPPDAQALSLVDYLRRPSSHRAGMFCIAAH